jgi:hypothetical protein
MNLYRNKQNGKLYTIEHLVNDIKHLNCNAFSGIYARPYHWNGETIEHTLGESSPFNPKQFVKDNFEFVAELRHL